MDGVASAFVNGGIDLFLSKEMDLKKETLQQLLSAYEMKIISMEKSAEVKF